MAFRDYSQQFAPVNVFGGFGKGLGEGLGGGITKSVRRPIFRALADRFKTGNEEKAQLNTLAQMGLTAPPVQGDVQYPVFQQMKDVHLAQLNQRPDKAKEIWETDQEAAREYLLAEDEVYAAKGTGGKEGKEALRDNPQALADATAIVNLRERLITETDPTVRQQLTGELVKLEGMYEFKYGEKAPSRDTLNQYRDAALAPLKQEKEELDIQAKQLGVGSDALKQAQAFAEKKITATSANKLVDQANQLKTAVSRIQGLVGSFGKIKDNPSALFTAVKSLAQIIEPGLQVTEGEARAFLGETAVQKFVQAIQQSGEAGKALIDFFGSTNKSGKALDSAAAAAGYDSPDQLWELLVLATNVANDTQTAYQEILGEIPLRAMAASDANMDALFTGNNITSPAKKRAIRSAVDMNISVGYPAITPMTPIPYGTPMPDSANPVAGVEGDQKPYEGGQFYADGTEASLTDAPAKLKANEQRTKKSVNPVNRAAQEMTDKAVDDLLSQGGY